jgi:hypothetical protein
MCKCITNLAVVIIIILKQLTFNFNLGNDEMTL